MDESGLYEASGLGFLAEIDLNSLPSRVYANGSKIVSGPAVINGVVHRVSACYVACNPKLNDKAWGVTEPQTLCELCYPPTIGVCRQLRLF